VYSLAVEPDGTLRPEWMNEAVFALMGGSCSELVAPHAWRGLVHLADDALVERRLCAILAGSADVSIVRIVARWRVASGAR
jgi:hypothetical protein